MNELLYNSALLLNYKNTMANLLLEDAGVISRVQKVWEIVFQASNKALIDEKRFGFTGMGVIPDPNIHQMILLLRALDAALVSIPSEFTDLPYEETRLILNARQQIAKMELVAAALKANDPIAFDDAIRELEKQACF